MIARNIPKAERIHSQKFSSLKLQLKQRLDEQGSLPMNLWSENPHKMISFILGSSVGDPAVARNILKAERIHCQKLRPLKPTTHDSDYMNTVHYQLILGLKTHTTQFHSFRVIRG